jgi:hypothetical protein
MWRSPTPFPPSNYDSEEYGEFDEKDMVEAEYDTADAVTQHTTAFIVRKSLT